MNFCIERLCYVVIGSVWIFWLGIVTTRGWHQRLLLLAMLSGLLVYSGIGSAMEGVAPEFVVFYMAFAWALVAGFSFGRIFFLPVSRSIGQRIPTALPDVDRRRVWNGVIVTYLLVSAFPLFWPKFRLHELLAPSAPDLTTMFFTRFFEEPDAPTRIANYVRLLITPFFFIAMYRYRFRLKWVALIFCTLLYVQYISNFCYIGRSTVMLHLLLLFLAAWIFYPESRTKLAIAFISCVPVFFLLSYAYAMIRIGGTVGHVSLRESIDAVVGVELGLVKRAGMVIYKAGARVDLADFVTWIATLPVPKVLTGPIEGARINYEISELVLGCRVGSPGWHVVLCGLLSESIYIYGKHLFWLHAFFLGGLAAFCVSLLECVPQFLFLFLYVVLLFGYNLNRAGIGALLPTITNQFLLFYLFVFTPLWGPLLAYRSPAICLQAWPSVMRRKCQRI